MDKNLLEPIPLEQQTQEQKEKEDKLYILPYLQRKLKKAQNLQIQAIQALTQCNIQTNHWQYLLNHLWEMAGNEREAIITTEKKRIEKLYEAEELRNRGNCRTIVFAIGRHHVSRKVGRVFGDLSDVFLL